MSTSDSYIAHLNDGWFLECSEGTKWSLTDTSEEAFMFTHKEMLENASNWHPSIIFEVFGKCS